MIRTLKSLFHDTGIVRLSYHRMKGVLAPLLYRHPSRELRVIGVTGTDGKTTTVAMVSHILRHAGKKTGAATSAFFEVLGTREPNPSQKTSLPAFALQKFLRRLSDEGCEFAVLECSSHGLFQGRLGRIRPEVAAITNISMEHLDYHGSMDEYLAAKSLLFTMLRGKGTKVLNAEDMSFAVLKDIPSERTVTFSTGEKSADGALSYRLTDIRGDARSSRATVHAGNEERDLTLSIPGTFNLENALCAIGCTGAVGVPLDVAIDALSTFGGAPGRLQRIDEGQDFSVFIDFTVTPVAYEKTLASLRMLVPENGRLLVLTGSCGDRMREKRPLIGKICAQRADVVVVTNEDPYTENPQAIIDEVFAGIPDDLPMIDDEALRDPPHRSFCVKIPDRRKAISFLLSHARQGDVVLFAGKGGDTMMYTSSGQIPWDEDAIVREELRALKKR